MHHKQSSELTKPIIYHETQTNCQHYYYMITVLFCALAGDDSAPDSNEAKAASEENSSMFLSEVYFTCWIGRPVDTHECEKK